jgi:ribose 5-phosphate isomerase B
MSGNGQALPTAFASDHGGYELKSALVEWVKSQELPYVDLGTHGSATVDYPDCAAGLCKGILEGRFQRGVLVCGSGIGMSMAANRFPGVRAALCTSAYMARMARAHNDANVLCLGERVVGVGEAEDILRTFLDAPFEGGRHSKRVGKLDSLFKVEKK